MRRPRLDSDPVWNEREHIIPCLDSLLAGDVPLDDLEVLVINGMSDDETAAIVRAYAATHRPVRLPTPNGLSHPH
jgi:glycosyltransferase involved in cell wall biosynthesis